MKRNVVGISAVALVLTGIGAWYFVGSGAILFWNAESIIIGGMSLDPSALIYIAVDQGFFVGNGLNVTLRDDYPAG